MEASHGTCDPGTYCDPESLEADILTGNGEDALRVGLYMPPACVVGDGGGNGGGSDVAAGNGTGWPLAPVEFVVCHVDERLGGDVILVDKATYDQVGGTQGCRWARGGPEPFTLPNPPIQLSSPTPSLTQSFTTEQAPLTPVIAVADAVVLAADLPSPCRLSAEGGAYLRSGTTWYRHDRRIAYGLNTVSQPVAGTNGTEGVFRGPYEAPMCPAVLRSFLNEGGCTKAPTCNRLQLSEACGSPAEVANDPTLGHRYRTYLNADEKTFAELDFPHSNNEAKGIVWTNVVLGVTEN